MLRNALWFLAVASLTAAGMPEAEVSSGPDEYIWRGEYDNALSAVKDGSKSDIAACLTMAGDVGRASEILDRGYDHFRKGILAFKSGSFGKALELTGDIIANPYLEGYRCAIRAASFHEEGMNGSAAAEIDAFFELIEKDPATANHPALPGVVNLDIEVRVDSQDQALPVYDDFGYPALLSRKSVFLAAGRYLESGLTEQARVWLLKGEAIERDTTGTGLFTGLIEGFGSGPGFGSFSRQELLSTADEAVRKRSNKAARLLIREIAGRFPGDYEIKFLKGRLLSRTGNHRKALRLFESIFSSGAPVSLKKEALLQMASTDYRLKRMKSASGRYRLFGMYYPDDKRSAGALDNAARIEVSRKNWSRALMIWKELRIRGNDSSLEKQAALSEAVLRYRLGAVERAYRILEDLLPRTGGRHEAAVLYWLRRTSPTPESARLWSMRLIQSYPLSFYAMESRESSDYTPFLEDEIRYRDQGPELESMECLERKFFDSLEPGLLPGDSIFTNPAYAAYIYFLENGLLEEAEDCGKALVKLFGRDQGRLSLVYKKAREKGMVGFALSLLKLPAFGRSDGNFPLILRYPIVYSGIVSEQGKTRDIPADLVLAVIREESRFDRYAVSSAGARGLMQIVPSTGSWVAGKMGEKDVSGYDLFSPRLNIRAGIWYLRYLLNRFEGSPVSALAAYNAGAARMRRWQKTFKPSEDPMVAIELIGVKETREYVKKVLDSMVIYRLVYGAGNINEI